MAKQYRKDDTKAGRNEQTITLNPLKAFRNLAITFNMNFRNKTMHSFFRQNFSYYQNQNQFEKINQFLLLFILLLLYSVEI